MYWLFLLIAIAAFVFALSAKSTALMVGGLFLTLVLLLLWVKGLYAAKFGSVVNDVPRPLHPSELQALREQLRPAASTPDAAPAAPASAALAVPNPPLAPQPQDPSQP